MRFQLAAEHNEYFALEIPAKHCHTPGAYSRHAKNCSRLPQTIDGVAQAAAAAAAKGDSASRLADGRPHSDLSLATSTSRATTRYDFSCLEGAHYDMNGCRLCKCVRENNDSNFFSNFSRIEMMHRR